MNIYVVIKNRVAEVLSDGGRQPLLVSGNTDSRILFTFDDEWRTKAGKTARFVYREQNGHGSMVYCDVPIEGNSVTVPFFQNVSELWVGVIAGDGIATSAARIPCVPSISGITDEEADAWEEIAVRALSFKNGNHTVSSGTGRPMRSVTIEKPLSLLPENIRSGVTIAGITGTYSASGISLATPFVTLDGDTLNVEYAPEGTEYILIYADGTHVSGSIAVDGSGTLSFDIRDHLGQLSAGTYEISVEARGSGGRSERSAPLLYTYAGGEPQSDYLIAFGGFGEELSISIDYKIGKEDLSEYVEIWDAIEHDGTVTSPPRLTGIFTDDYVLFELPEGISVSGYSNCICKTFEDPRFIQLSGFTENFAVVRITTGESDEEESDTIAKPTIRIDGDSLITSFAQEAEWLLIYADGSPVASVVSLEEHEGSVTIDLRSFLSDLPVGTYQISAEVWGSGLSSAVSSALTYTYSDPLPPVGTYIIAFGGATGIEIDYKLGKGDLSEYVTSWDDIEPDGSTVTPEGLQGRFLDDYVLLCLPKGVRVSGYVNCAVKYYSDARFVQLSGFTEAFAVVNLVEEEVYTLATTVTTTPAGSICYGINVTEEAFKQGTVTATKAPTVPIEVREGDVVYVRFKLPNAYMRLLENKGCDAELIEDRFLRVTNFTENATLKVEAYA